jgi:hypothetical protein
MTYGQYLRLRLHVSASPRSVIRAAHGMLSAQGKGSAMRANRHAWIRTILAEHVEAQALARRVGGR